MKHSPAVILSVLALSAGTLVAQTTAPASTSAQTPAPAATPAPATPPVWSLGSLDFSGYIDGYYSFNANRPSNAANGQINDVYSFNDKTDQFNLSALKLTINHDADPVGVHVDLIFGRTNVGFHPASDKDTDSYIEQAYISTKPPKTHGTEIDFGQFVTSAGAEVAEAKDDFNYSRSLLYTLAEPLYHFGVRTSTPVNKVWTAGVQLVNGWNNVVDNNGGVTVGLTSAVTLPKFGWAVNYYTGPENTDTQKGYRNLIDSVFTFTPSPKFSAYVNVDYVRNRTTVPGVTKTILYQLPGVAFAAHEAVTGKASLSERFEYLSDSDAYATGVSQKLKEFTATYEYKWAAGLLSRIEYRRDFSDQNFFHKGDTRFVKNQSTLTAAFIAFFGPKR